MSGSIYKLDDGSTWWFDAADPLECKRQWLAIMQEQGYSADQAIADFGEPEIERVQLVDAAKVKISTDERTDPCPHCHGTGHVQAFDSLLDVWRDNNQKPTERKAPHGALANSEWP
jgi:excinuclease UvrABC ATPase subunit